MEPTAENIQQLVKDLGNEDAGAAYKAEHILSTMAAHAADPDKGDERAAVAAALAAELIAETEYKDRDKTRTRPTHSARARRHVARCLSLVGGDKEVDALAKAMEDFDVRDMARFALERNPTAATTAALITAVDHVGTDFRVGVVNALGRCHCEASMNALRSLTSDADGEVRLAAAEALAGFAEPTHDAIIAGAAKADAPRAEARAAKARIRLAETLRNAGEQAAATRIYNTMKQSNKVAPAQRKAAELALNPKASNTVA